MATAVVQEAKLATGNPTDSGALRATFSFAANPGSPAISFPNRIGHEMRWFKRRAATMAAWILRLTMFGPWPKLPMGPDWPAARHHRLYAEPTRLKDVGTRN